MDNMIKIIHNNKENEEYEEHKYKCVATSYYNIYFRNLHFYQSTYPQNSILTTIIEEHI